jgi:hypothetical protein
VPASPTIIPAVNDAASRMIIRTMSAPLAPTLLRTDLGLKGVSMRR